MPERYSQEIIELHQFFEAWFKGELPKTETAFARFAETMAETFAIISPSGVLTERPALIDGLFRAHGQRADVRIWIDHVHVHHTQGDISIVTYEEWQQIGESDPTARLSTVIFQQDATAPNGLRWLHVHETWMPEKK